MIFNVWMVLVLKVTVIEILPSCHREYMVMYFPRCYNERWSQAEHYSGGDGIRVLHKGAK